MSNRQPLLRYRGHTDFVKCVATLKLASTDIIISGAADASIIVWNLHLAERIYVLKGHTRGILDLAIDPSTYGVDSTVSNSTEEAVLFSAGSDREIRRWWISLKMAEQIEPEKPILVHETSVYALRFDVDEDLWTASADGTTKCLSRVQDFQSDTTIQHGDYVRAVVLEDVGGYVVTAGRSEDVNVWDRGSGDLVHVFEGHFDEITGLIMLGQNCVSVGIDGTVRVWSLVSEDLRNARKRKEADRKALLTGAGTTEFQPAEESTPGGITEEEDRELEELMQDDE